MIAAATLIPLVLMLVSGGLPFIFGAVIFLLSGSWVIRLVYVKIPHTSPAEIGGGLYSEVATLKKSADLGFVATKDSERVEGIFAHALAPSLDLIGKYLE